MNYKLNLSQIFEIPIRKYILGSNSYTKYVFVLQLQVIQILFSADYKVFTGIISLVHFRCTVFSKQRVLCRSWGLRLWGSFPKAVVAIDRHGCPLKRGRSHVTPGYCYSQYLHNYILVSNKAKICTAIFRP